MADSRDINPISPGERTEKSTTLKPESVVYSENVGSTYSQETRQPGALVKYGHSEDGDKVPEAYKVKITSYRNNAKVIGLMQDDIQLKVASSWVPAVPTNASALGNILVQAITGGSKSLISKTVSRRVWSGTSPIVMSLNLRFEAVNDADREVVEPCRVLQSLALPSEFSGFSENESGEREESLLLGPPGPSPFLLEKYQGDNKTIQDATSWWGEYQGGDLIIVELGGFLTFYNVIVSEVSVQVPPKFTRDNRPIGATVHMTFETYEMPTVESLKSAYSRASLSRGVE
jgi:hypothetical protein